MFYCTRNKHIVMVDILLKKQINDIDSATAQRATNKQEVC